MSPIDDCCWVCKCGRVVCNQGTNACSHGLAVCEGCTPGDCDECALEMGLRAWGQGGVA